MFKIETSGKVEDKYLISDIIEITSTQQVEGFLIKMDVEKDFDSLDHKFLISVLKNLNLVKTLSRG